MKVIYFLLVNAYFWHRKQVVLSCIGKNDFPKEKKSTSSCKKKIFHIKKICFMKKKTPMNVLFIQFHVKIKKKLLFHTWKKKYITENEK